MSDCRYYCSFTEVGCLIAAQSTDRAAAVFMDGCNLLSYRLEQCMHTDTTHNRQSVTLHVSTVGVIDQSLNTCHKLHNTQHESDMTTS